MHDIQIISLATGQPTSLSGQWVVDCDVDAHEGRGHIETTPIRRLAQKFPDALAAVQYYQREAKGRYRHDGKISRPLTAYTVVIAAVPDEAE